ncbi:unnamed protein product [Zymoseptoria tritici ST99CH_1E4]|uniref:Rho-GAP domain-containing protein n=1 Tax=Zymoseptoria tritici ST99CH_1E4 TaxID=1276532 RepID=A0A2H1FLM4_ZYMTR|nr:unnamed protein product [Zymoseptoria tritici ST99CH_1E4]
MASGPSTAAIGASGPKPTPLPTHSESGKEKKDLASWWKNFKRSDKKGHEPVATPGIFGVPLQTSIRYANVAISLFNEEGQSYIYGYVPIVVAKCGVFLKDKATDVEGIFRLAGSEKRIKELKVAFDSPDRYGKGLDWTGYTVHDAANILRRYFNQLPEPIIPLEFYQRFRDPLRNHQAQAVGAIEAQSPSEGEFDHVAAIRVYQSLITELPPLNRQLLLYILDLLAVFASKSDMNKMTTPNLAAIFQPGILNHPQHGMAPEEYRLSQDVLIFLIENQDSFLIGMQGTAADPETVREVQSGAPAKGPATPTTPSRAKTVIGRSTSNSSVAAESVRKWGSIRRNVSVSSKHSKQSESVVQTGSPVATPPTPTGAVHRSNTVPSRRGVSATHSPRFTRDRHSGSPSPNTSPNPGPSGDAGKSDAQPQRPVTAERTPAGPTALATKTEPSTTADRSESLQNTPIAAAAPASLQRSSGPTSSETLVPVTAPIETRSASFNEATTPVATTGANKSSPSSRDHQTPARDFTPVIPPRISSDRSTNNSASNTPSNSNTSGRKFLDILQLSPEGEGRKPNKLRKKRQPGSAMSSAHSSTHSLDERAERYYEPAQHPRMISPGRAGSADMRGVTDNNVISQSAQVPATPQRTTTDATTKPAISPSNSMRSHTDVSDADMVGDDMPFSDSEHPEKKKRNRWRFSRSQDKPEAPTTPGNHPFGTMTGREQAMSRSTIGSGGSYPRKSLQQDAPPLASVGTEPVPGSSPDQRGIHPAATSDVVFSDSERERKGPMSWLRNKLHERKEKDAEKRSQTPDRAGHERNKSKSDVLLTAESRSIRGSSIDDKRPSLERPVTTASQTTATPATEGLAAAGDTPVHKTQGEDVEPTVETKTEPNLESKPETNQESIAGAKVTDSV